MGLWRGLVQNMVIDWYSNNYGTVVLADHCGLQVGLKMGA